MIGISKLHNPIQSYPWGSRTAIAEFLGLPAPAAAPQAELWMGAHAKAPSALEVGGQSKSLPEVIRQSPREILGDSIAEDFDDTLPFLLKVLAAERALSIQAHPDARQARAGFARENGLGLPLSAPQRNYRDPRHKPEILYALEPFWILRGFRPCADIVARLRPVGLLQDLGDAGAALLDGDLERFLSAYLRLDAARIGEILPPALTRIGARAATDDAYRWVVELDRQFPKDRGVLAPLFLHLLELQPGEAIFTGPGILHAYLSGVGVELMANSDNVVRGGLTTKHVDVEELIAILRFDDAPPRRLGSTVEAGERRFEAESNEIDLAVIEVKAPRPHSRSAEHGVEILLCSAGGGVVRETASGRAAAFARGEALLVPAAVGGYRIEGTATVFRAGTPLADGAGIDPPSAR